MSSYAHDYLIFVRQRSWNVLANWHLTRHLRPSVTQRSLLSRAITIVTTLTSLKGGGEARPLPDTIPSTVTHNDMFMNNMYKPAHSDNYMFFDLIEGYVAHPFAVDMNGIDRKSFLEEWTAYGTMEQLQNWRNVGSGLRVLIKLILRLQEANMLEQHP